MRKRIFTDEIEQYIKDNAAGKSTEELTIMINQKYGTSYTRSQLRTYKGKNKIKSGQHKRKIYSIFPDEIKLFIEENYTGISNLELTQKVNAAFGTTYTKDQVRGYKQRKKLASGVCSQFPKGHIPHNKGVKGIYYPGCEKGWFPKGHMPKGHKPVGTEVIDNKDGYTLVKIADPNVWGYKHRLVWEERNGPVPKGHSIIFLDGNKSNFDINNLECVARSELLILNRQQLIHTDAEITETGVLVARLIDTRHKRKRDKSGKSNRYSD